MFKHFCDNWAYSEPIFCYEVSEIFFHIMFTLILLNGFSKFQLFIVENGILIRVFGVLYENYSMRWLSIHGNNLYENYSMRWLSIQGNNLIACWAYAETIAHWVYAERIFASAQPAFKFDSFYMVHGTWTSKRMLSQRENDFIAGWA